MLVPNALILVFLQLVNQGLDLHIFPAQANWEQSESSAGYVRFFVGGKVSHRCGAPVKQQSK